MLMPARTIVVITFLLSSLPLGSLRVVGQDYGDSYTRAYDSSQGNYSAPSEEQYRYAGRTYSSDGGSRGSQYVPNYVEGGKYRQPTAIVFLDEQIALVPTKLTGELYRLDSRTRELQVVFHREGAAFGPIAKIDRDTIAVGDSATEEVVLLSRQNQRWMETARLLVPGNAHSIVYDATERRLLVTGIWSRRLYQWKFRDGAAEALSSVDLPFNGGKVLPLPSHAADLVTDAFGRGFAVVDSQAGCIINSGELYEHNVAELVTTSDGKSVLYPHQLLNEFLPTVRNDITWGGLLSNNLRWIEVDNLIHERGDALFKGSRFYPLGIAGNGAGDPTSLCMNEDKLVAVTLGGMDQVAIGSEVERRFASVDVGNRPVDCEFSPNQSELVVVNQFSDSLTFVDLSDQSVEHLALGDIRAPSVEERGEQLFFNSRLSHDGWMSCNSCHTNGHSNGQLNDNSSDKSFGTPKRVLSLLGQAHTAPYSWSGSAQTLENQIASSIELTMASDQNVDTHEVEAIGKYIRTLVPPPGILAARLPRHTRSSLGGDSLVSEGAKLFREIGCADCHKQPWFTTTDSYDVGLQDEQSMKHFNPPSLRGVSQREGELFHDGRTETLRDVLVSEKHQLSSSLSEEDLEKLLTFLRAL